LATFLDRIRLGGRLWFHPERSRLSNLSKLGHPFFSILLAVRKVIRLQAPAKVFTREYLYQGIQGNDSPFVTRIELGPIADMLFRPEEIHGASGIRKVFVPFPHGNSHISHHPFRLNMEENAIFYIHPHGQSAIQAGCIDPDGPPGKKPADCQRFKSSLTKPLLPAVDRQAVLGRKIVEGGKGDDIVSPRE
jgi:hypothetical protein